jgi:hypothetical protein
MQRNAKEHEEHEEHREHDGELWNLQVLRYTLGCEMGQAMAEGFVGAK